MFSTIITQQMCVDNFAHDGNEYISITGLDEPWATFEIYVWT